MFRFEVDKRENLGADFVLEARGGPFFHLLIYVFCSIFIIAELAQVVCEVILIMLRHTLPITPILILYCQYFNICILKMTKLGGVFEVLI